MCIKKIKEYICGKEQEYDISPPSPLVEISYTSLANLLNATFPSAGKYLSDSKYKTTTIQELKRFLDWDKTSEKTYISEWFDCDDFSSVLNGTINIPEWYYLPFGIMWTDTPQGGHAVNIFIDNMSEIWIVEPQNDSCFKLPSDWNPYLIII